MADPSRVQRVEYPSDPRRCQQVTGHGQCLIIAQTGSPYCLAHSTGFESRQEKALIRNLRLTKWKSQVEEMADNPQVKSLREEIGVLRVILQETMNRCETANDLIMFSNKLSDIVIKIEKLVVSCHRLEEKTGALLDKSAALQLGAAFVDVIAKEITDEAILDRISDSIMKLISDTHVVVKDNA